MPTRGGKGVARPAQMGLLPFSKTCRITAMADSSHDVEGTRQRGGNCSFPGPLKELPAVEQSAMELSIEYCGTCNYRPIAASLAMAIEKAVSLKAVLIHSRDMGALEVRMNGELIFSKKESGLFPDSSQIIEMIKARRDVQKK
jgi:selenoprotein W-related protein